jgi:hypothetical protein
MLNRLGDNHGKPQRSRRSPPGQPPSTEIFKHQGRQSLEIRVIVPQEPEPLRYGDGISKHLRRRAPKVRVIAPQRPKPRRYDDGISRQPKRQAPKTRAMSRVFGAWLSEDDVVASSGLRLLRYDGPGVRCLPCGIAGALAPGCLILGSACSVGYLEMS